MIWLVTTKDTQGDCSYWKPQKKWLGGRYAATFSSNCFGISRKLVATSPILRRYVALPNPRPQATGYRKPKPKAKTRQQVTEKQHLANSTQQLAKAGAEQQ